ncbi:methylated-DNA--[protein]-cysteine S-methyltransferase [Rhodococcus sp. HM1]|uniref:methylated-DNA--[protein]-cysteine S-methyltransferase n=1 Tax=Rhodococcus sp. HM1 TaxID=2937759 RepID=UPI00200B76F8|nr:methylated-DNA--[protein]-cysteine S-methyltransferase [Rhodococcus sp. HM1]MCK8671627.1 methylated-DNA--[protein]-cysteine S-methyltransferase [Rhodococcus sp. HM1]
MNLPRPEVSTTDLAWLHTRLVVDAEAAGLLDLAYRVVDSPVGPLLVAATGAGIVRVAFASDGYDDILDDLAARISPRILEAPARLDSAARQLDEYFHGRRHTFDLPLDLRLATGFRRDVIVHLPTIAYGHTASYAEIAAASGSPRAVRAVGTACAKNPLPVIVPCHRVVRSDGGIGQYVGGVDAKRALLQLESSA